MSTDLEAIALSALKAVAADPAAPAAARASAARTLLEAAGMIGRHAPEPSQATTKPSNELSKAELLAEVQRLRHSKGDKPLK